MRMINGKSETYLLLLLSDMSADMINSFLNSHGCAQTFKQLPWFIFNLLYPRRGWPLKIRFKQYASALVSPRLSGFVMSSLVIHIG